MQNRSTNIQQSGRLYFFDWLRIIAFGVVLLIHCEQMFGDLYQITGNTLAKDAGQVYILSFFLPQWCMSLFFLLAGASTWLALRKKTVRAFVQERVTRLLIPLVIGFIIMAPLQTYFAMVSNGQYHGSLPNFYRFFLDNILFYGNADWIIIKAHHLWFLAYLFGFSLITLPLCLHLRTEKGQRWLKRFAGLCEQPGGLLAPVLPLALVQVTLRAAFPVYCSLTDALSWMLFYMYGYTLFANPGFRQILRQQARLALITGVAGFILIAGCWRMGILQTWLSTPDYSPACLLFQALATLTLWSWLLVTLALGDRYLNKTGTFLKYSSTGSFWWYLVHFPIVVIAAYYILPLHLNVLVGFFVIGGISAGVTFLLSDAIMRIESMRMHGKTRVRVAEALAHNPQNVQITGRLQQLEQARRTGKLGTQPLIG